MNGLLPFKHLFEVPAETEVKNLTTFVLQCVFKSHLG